jgi:GNAT superfamily N-acetyltransferase
VPAAARTTTTEAAGLAARARAFDSGVFERAAEHVTTVGGATVVSTPSLPLARHLNRVVVHGGDLDADAVEALAAEHLGTLPERLVVVDDETAGERLAAELPARGWELDRLMLLGRDGGVPPPEAGMLAEEVPYGHVRGLRDEWIRGSPWAKTDELIRQVHEADRRLTAGTATRSFAAFEQGRPLAYALLIDGGRDGMLEDVYTTPEARGRGLATGVIAAVLHASRAERHEAVFVPTEAGGRAQALYERLGFVPLAVQHRFAKGSA